MSTPTPSLQAISNLAGRVAARTNEPGVDHEAWQLADATRQLLQQIGFLHANLRDMHADPGLTDTDIVEHLNHWLADLGLTAADTANPAPATNVTAILGSNQTPIVAVYPHDGPQTTTIVDIAQRYACDPTDHEARPHSVYITTVDDDGRAVLAEARAEYQAVHPWDGPYRVRITHDGVVIAEAVAR